MPASPKQRAISIIIPVCNEAGLLRNFLLHLRERIPAAEVVVVDGDSSDSSLSIAQELADKVASGARGRASQLNAGARMASAQVLWFLHADTEIPSTALEEIKKALSEPKVSGGYFRIRLPKDNFVYRLTDCFAHYAGKILRIRCGDHGFFCRRSSFQAIGGFANLPLMEDVQFYRALRRHGTVVTVNARLLVSSRRYERIGPWKLTFGYGLIALLYAMKFPNGWLYAMYNRLCRID